VGSCCTAIGVACGLNWLAVCERLGIAAQMSPYLYRKSLWSGPTEPGREHSGSAFSPNVVGFRGGGFTASVRSASSSCMIARCHVEVAIGEEESLMRQRVLLFLNSALLVATARAQPTLPGISPGDTLRLLMRSRDWRDGVLDSIAPGRIYLRDRTDSPPIWIECHSVDRAYRQRPPGVSASGALTGFAIGVTVGAIVGIFTAHAQECEACDYNPGPIHAFVVSTTVGAALGTVVGLIPRHRWTRVAACPGEQLGD
jgi:hypothetical protein